MDATSDAMWIAVFFSNVIAILRRFCVWHLPSRHACYRSVEIRDDDVRLASKLGLFYVPKVMRGDQDNVL